MTTRREAISTLIGTGIAVGFAGKSFAAPAQRKIVVTPAKLERPKTRTDRAPFAPKSARMRGPLDEQYIAEEWFASGTDDTGRPYATQVFVYRPRDPARFSGIVIAESLHAHGVAPINTYCAPYMMRSGHASVCIVSQKVALEKHVKPAAPDHYASLHIEADPPLPGAPTDLTESPVGRLSRADGIIWWDAMDRANQASDAILAQVGAALRLGQGPFAGYRVRKTLLVGHSETGFVSTNYVKRAHDTHRMPGGGPVYDGFMPSGFPVKPFGPRDVPLIQVICEGDVYDGNFNIRAGFEGRQYRRPDSDRPDDRYRLYELAGAPHTGTRYPPMNNVRMWPQMFPGGPTYSGPRAALSDDTPTNGMVMNSMPHNELFNMALNHLILWVDKGIVPPRAPRLKLAPGGRYFAKDANGNALGGIRTAQMDVPHATYHANNVKPDGTPAWAAVGLETAFSPAKMRALYGTPANYVARFNRRLDELVRQGWFLAEDTPDMRKEAAGQTW